MSMTAKFVQVDENDLARIRSNPSTVEALFDESTGFADSMSTASPLTAEMQERVRTLGPQILAKAAAGLSPGVRKALEARMGIGLDSLAAGEGGDKLAKLMEERRAKAADRMSMAGSHKQLSIDKNWHGLHFLLCGSAEPDGTVLGDAILGGTELEEDEGFSGYGPARLLSADQVKKISAELNQSSSFDQAASRFDAEKMSALHIYPRFRASDVEELMNALHRLRDFYCDAAQQDKSIVACLV